MRLPSQLTAANRGYLAALASALFKSLTPLIVHFLSFEFNMPALVLAFWREALVAVILLVLLALFKPALLRGLRAHRPFLLLFGLSLALYNATWTLSVPLNGASVATVLAYSSTAFTALLGWLVLREQLGALKLLAVLLCLLGCGLVLEVFNGAAWSLNALGILVGLLSGLMYAFFTLMGRAAALRGLNPWSSLAAAFALASLLMLVVNLAFGAGLPGGARRPADLFWLGRSALGWGMLLLMAAGPTLLGYGMYNVSLKHLPSSVVNLLLTLEPACTALMAFLIFGERLGAWQVAGSLLILAGVLLLRLKPTR